jgi:hypothetical protein
MIATTDMAERQGRVLAELAELGLSLARGLEAKVQAAQTVEEAQGLALAFHRAARSVRLSLALEVRLARELMQGGREARVQLGRAVDRRKEQVRAVVTREVMTESESDEAESLLDELEERLDEAALFDDFAAGEVEAQIARIRAGLGLPAQGAADDARGDATAPSAAAAAAWPRAGPRRPQ